MKRVLLTFVALGIATAAVAQSTQAPASNAVLISQTRQGDNIVSHYKIPHDNDKQAGFDLHYAVNNSTIVDSYSDNPRQIEDLKDFMAQTTDTLMHISAIHIVGYASPDGNTKQNDTLASKRAQSLYHYAVNAYHPKQTIDTSHKTFRWCDCVSAVEKSDIPQKDKVLAVLKSTSHTEAEKEAALRKMPESWRYLATHILPQMRYADIEFEYGVDEIVTRTTMVSNPQPAKPAVNAPQQPAQAEPVLVEEETGVIVAVPVEESRHRSKREPHRQRKSGKADTYEVIYW